MEREIRGLKRQVECGVDDVKGKLVVNQAQYKVYCRHMGLKENYGRLRIQGYDRSVVQKTRKAAERQYEDWLKSIGAENTTLNTLENTEMQSIITLKNIKI